MAPEWPVTQPVNGPAPAVGGSSHHTVGYIRPFVSVGDLSRSIKHNHIIGEVDLIHIEGGYLESVLLYLGDQNSRAKARTAIGGGDAI
jgi:hypothetical protein